MLGTDNRVLGHSYRKVFAVAQPAVAAIFNGLVEVTDEDRRLSKIGFGEIGCSVVLPFQGQATYCRGARQDAPGRSGLCQPSLH